ncbi:Tudor-like [Macleaya cordata]|uniref:Tudor-like n=1 Tax=Macleaya cordata TaxID=56857 RepID=A0A200QC80_MACCD|nr:Tudor-like [Macleaya cordata]
MEFRRDHDETRLLREIVDASNVRPFPPEIEVSEFSVLDKVDVYANDGWWVGRISAIADSSRYFVYFESTGDELAYPISKLRVHQELENGKWVVSHYRKVHFVTDVG